MDKLVLIDGNSLLNRAFYATPVFSTSSGQPTNAIFGFVKLILKIMGDLCPEYFIVAFDLKAPTFRHKMYDGYKATRHPMPDELASQVEPLKSLLAAMKIATCQKEGLEADDIIGTLSSSFDVHSYIYTGDRDSFQLVDEKTDVFFTKRGVSDLQKLSVANFKEEIGFEPSAVIDFKALMGDKSDNIPGVAGIGEKTARGLIETYGNLSNIYANIDNIKPDGVRKKLESGRDMAELSYTLATIDRHCQLDVSLENCRTPERYSAEVKDMFKRFEFKSLLSLDIFENSQGQAKGEEYPVPEDIDDYDELESFCSANGTFFVDIKDDGAQIYFDGKLKNVVCSCDSLFCKLSYDGLVSCLDKMMDNAENTVVLFDYKKYLHARPCGYAPKCKVEDLSVLCYLADSDVTVSTLKALCEDKGFGAEYSAYAMSVLYSQYVETLKSQDMTRLYTDIERPLIEVLYEMEAYGVKVDRAQLEAFGVEYTKKLDELSHKIYSMCGQEFNINSPAQLGEVLFEKLGLKSGKKGKTGKYSTSAEILEKLAEDNEVVRYILRYRQYQKLYSTYIEGFRPLLESRTDLVHTTYNQTVTSTGRLSSANPNLQNIPIRENEGRELRKLFVAREGNLFIDADYSQIELRLLAHFSGCKELIKAYEDGQDVHAFTASQVFNVPMDMVTPEMRRQAKAVNFGIIYGISEFGLAKNLNIPVKTAKEYIEKYFERYGAVKEYMQANVEFAKKHGYVATMTGRKRYIKEINSSNYNLRQFGERAAMNMPLQGTSADIIKIAMVNISRALKQENLRTRLILQVHDELVLEAPEDEVQAAQSILVREMENAVRLNVPLKVDVHSGKNWYEAK